MPAVRNGFSPLPWSAALAWIGFMLALATPVLLRWLVGHNLFWLFSLSPWPLLAVVGVCMSRIRSASSILGLLKVSYLAMLAFLVAGSWAAVLASRPVPGPGDAHPLIGWQHLLLAALVSSACTLIAFRYAYRIPVRASPQLIQP